MLTLLKLGGSLITDKTQPYTLRKDVLDRAAAEVASALEQKNDLQLLIGHGSGSFGHQAAVQFRTRDGVSTPEQWRGFADVWFRASELNRHVLEAFRNVGLPVVTVSPFSSVSSRDGKVVTWDKTSLLMCLEKGLLPIIHGDVVFDERRGGTILSTEDLFIHLAQQLRPKRILLAGLEPGIWSDFPARKSLLEELTPENLDTLDPHLERSGGVDVTGGMKEKVRLMLSLCRQDPNLEILIFSGERPKNILAALTGEDPGTRLHC